MTITDHDLLVTDPGAGRYDGSGILASTNDFVNSHGALDGAANGLSFYLSAVGFVKDPFESVLSSGIGYLIEHVSFLREPLNQLAGNPNAIQAHAQTWQKIAHQLNDSAQQWTTGVQGLGGVWQGDAQGAYQSNALTQADTIGRGAQSADELSGEILTGGAMVGVVRTLIRDLIAKFLAKVIERALLALAASVETLGVSVAVFVADLVAEGISLAGTISGKIAELLKALSQSGSRVAALAGKVEGLAQGLGRAGQAAKAGVPAAVPAAVHRSVDKGLSVLPEKVQAWAYDPPEGGVGTVLGQAARESGDDIWSDLKDPTKFLREKVAVQTGKQAAKAHETESEWTPL